MRTFILTICFSLFALRLFSQTCPDTREVKFDFGNSQTSFCEGQPLTAFNDSRGDDNTFDYIWIWGDNSKNDTVPDRRKMDHTYNITTPCSASSPASAVYTVTLRMERRTDRLNCFTIAAKTIFIYRRPKADFTAVQEVCADNPVVNFTNTTCPSNNVSFFWQFIDPSTGRMDTTSVKNPQYLFPHVGTYTVNLSVSSAVCGSNSVPKPVNVRDSATASARYPIQAHYCAPQTIIFENLSQNAASYNWTISPSDYSFANGTSSNSTNPTIVFNRSTVYTVTLTVKNACGTDKVWQTKITINAPPSVKIDSIRPFCRGGAVAPRLGLAEEGGLPTTYKWTFEGGTPATYEGKTPPTVQWQTAGYFKIKVEATNDCDIKTDETFVRISEAAQAFVTMSGMPSNNCGPFTVSFNNTSLGDTRFDWTVLNADGTITNASAYTFDNNTTAHSRHPQITFRQAGQYKVVLSVVNPCGDATWTSEIIIVKPPPSVKIEPLSLSGMCRPQTVQLRALLQTDGGLWTHISWRHTSDTNLILPPQRFDTGGIFMFYITAINACSSQTDSVKVTIQERVKPYIDKLDKDIICNSAAPFTLSAFPFGGVWSSPTGVIDSNGRINPTVMPNGRYAFIYTFGSNDCTEHDTLFLSFFGTPVSAGLPQTACGMDAPPVILVGAIPQNGGIWRGLGIIDSIRGIFTPSVGLGVFILNYVFKDSISGCPNIAAKTVTVHERPKADLSSLPVNVCQNMSFSTVNNLPPNTDCLWLFGDGDSSRLIQPSHSYIQTGVFSLKLFLKNQYNCLDSAIQQITVAEPPRLAIEKDVQKGCSPLRVGIKSRSQGNISNLEWQTSDGQIFRDSNVIHPIFVNNGERDTFVYLTLKANSAVCPSAQLQDSFRIFALAKARFTVDIDTGCSPLFVKYHQVSTGLPLIHQWIIDSSRFFTVAEPPTQRFDTDSVVRRVRSILIATNQCGSDTAFHINTVLPTTVKAFYNINARKGCTPFTIYLKNGATNGSQIVYTLSNGISLNQPDTNYTFLKAGVYMIRQFAFGVCGADSTKVDTIVIKETPSVSLQYQQVYNCDKRLVNLNAQVSTPSEIQWDFGDNSPVRGTNPIIYEYPNNGYFTARIRVTSISTGCFNTDSTVIFVRPPLKLDIINQKDVSCFGQRNGSISIRSSGSPNIIYSLDDSTFRQPNTTGIFGSLKGNKAYTIWARDSIGCVLSKQVFIHESASFFAHISGNLFIELGDSTILSLVLNPPKTVTTLWQTNNYLLNQSISCPSCLETWVKPTETTTYYVHVRDSLGCSTADTVRVVVDKKRLPIYKPTAFSPNDDGINDYFTIYGNHTVEKIKSLRIFNRWGGIVFEKYNFEHSQERLGWDGTFEGKPLKPDVFVYIGIIQYIDGKEDMVKGDLTLFR